MWSKTIISKIYMKYVRENSTTKYPVLYEQNQRAACFAKRDLLANFEVYFQ